MRKREIILAVTLVLVICWLIYSETQANRLGLLLGAEQQRAHGLFQENARLYRENERLDMQLDILDVFFQEDATTIAALQQEIRELEREILELQIEERFSHGFTSSEVREDFLQNVDNIDLSAIGLPERGWRFCESMVYVTPRYVIADVGYAWILFSYWMDRTHRRDSHWEMIGFDIGLGYFHIAPMPRERRYFTDAETVTLRFYYGTWTDDGADIVQQYVELETPGEYMWDEIIRNTQIRDLWLCGNRLYVDMIPMHFWSFNMGTMSVAFGLFPLLSTLTHNFPHAEEIVITFGGLHTGLDHHGAYYGIYVVGVGFVETEMFQYGWGWNTRMQN